MNYEASEGAEVQTTSESKKPIVDRIRALNDEFRKNAVGGQTQATKNVWALGPEFVDKALAAVKAFDAFTKDNDPWGEHDCAALSVDNEDVIFKIDYYDPTMTRHSDDPADAELTWRVLTIMLAEDW